MNRRQVLSATIPIPVGVAGCVGGGERVPDGIVVETRHRVGSHLIDADVGPSGERPRSSETLLTDRETASERTTDDPAVEAFVQETDFDGSYLLIVVAAAWPSGYWLELGAIDRTNDGLRLGIDPVSPDGSVGDDAAVHSLAIRITDEQNGVPDRVVIQIGDELTGTATAT